MSALLKKREELFFLGERLRKHPEQAGLYESERAKMADFDAKVYAVLDKFPAEHYRSLCAILNAIPTGNLDFLFSAWVDELRSLGLLKE